MRKSSENETKQGEKPETDEKQSAAGVQPSPEGGSGPAQDSTEGRKAEEADQKQSASPDMDGRIAELEKKNAELQDQYLRKAADFDNYRKRMIREKQEAIDFANTNLLVDLVPVLDDFDRAMQACGSPEEGSVAMSFLKGIAMIRNQLGSMLENKYGLQYYPVLGEHFDPHMHEAVATVPSPDAKEPVVSEEFVKGYKLKDRVIRLAKVVVKMPAENANG